MESWQQEFLERAAREIYAKKGWNVLVLDVRLCPAITDFVIVAEGSADVHVKAIAHHLLDEMYKQGVRPYAMQGLSEGDWIVMDCLWFVVHLFKPGMRERYDLESLWRESELVRISF